MSNDELIERLLVTLPTGIAFGLGMEAADALEAANKRIAELTEDLERMCIDAMEQRNQRREAERKLAVAEEALGIATTYSMLESDRKIIAEALAQIGGE